MTREGFTLIELMVALVAGLVAILAVYSITAGSSRHFHEQQRVASAQTALRVAMEQLRTDIERAGLYGTPSSLREQTCMTPATPVEAITLLDDFDTVALPNAAENFVTADRLRLTGNYATTGAYLMTGLNGAGTGVFLQTTWQSFRRDFGVPGTSFDAAAFARVFQAGRVLHIVTLQGNHFFPTIQSASAADHSVSIQGIGIAGNCVVGLADGATVAPLSHIEYAVVDPRQDPALAALVSANPNDVAIQGAPSVLVRRELTFGGAVIPGTTRVVLEFVADLDYTFVIDTNTVAGGTPQLQIFSNAAAVAALQANPGRARSVIVSLSVRTADNDRTFPFVARDGRAQPLTRYVTRTGGGRRPAARVRTVTTEILLPNLVR